MQNYYINSTLSLKWKDPLSFSLTDYDCILYHRYDRYLPFPSSSPSFCACCANSLYRRLPANPYFYHGLSRSTLIHCSVSRKLTLGVGDRSYSSPASHVTESCCCGHTCSLKERNLSVKGGGGERRFRHMVSLAKEENRRSYDTEVILNLLTEDEVGEDLYGSRERNKNRSSKVMAEKIKRRNDVAGSCRGKLENVGQNFLGSKSKSELESIRIRKKEEDYKLKEAIRRNEDEYHSHSNKGHQIRKEGSGCSSYYSCSSLDELESDNEDPKRDDAYGGEPLDKISIESLEHVSYNAETMHKDVKEGQRGVFFRQGKAVESYANESDWRKKSEKKFNDVSIEQTEAKESCYRNASNSLKKSVEEQRKQYSREDNQITGLNESRTNHKHSSEMEVNRIMDSENTTYISGKRFSSREDILGQETKQELYSRKGDNKRISHQSKQVSEIQEIKGGTFTSEKMSEAASRIQGNEQASSSIQETKQESYNRKGSNRRASHQSKLVSEIQEIKGGTSTSEKLSEAAWRIQGDEATASSMQETNQESYSRKGENRRTSHQSKLVSEMQEIKGGTSTSEKIPEATWRIQGSEGTASSIQETNQESYSRKGDSRRTSHQPKLVSEIQEIKGGTSTSERMSEAASRIQAGELSASSIQETKQESYSRKRGNRRTSHESKLVSEIQEIKGGISTSEKMSEAASRIQGGELAASSIQETKQESYSRKGDSSRTSHQSKQVSEIQEIKGTATSEKMSEAALRIQGGELASSSIHGIKGQFVTGQMESKLTDSSTESHKERINRTNQKSNSKMISDTRVKTQESTSSMVAPNLVTKTGRHGQTGQEAIGQIHSNKVSENENNVSVVHSTNIQVTNISTQETHSTTVMQLTGETSERHNRTYKEALQIGPEREEDQKPIKSLSFKEGSSKEDSSPQVSAIMRGKISQALVAPQPSQSVSRPHDFEMGGNVVVQGTDGEGRKDKGHWEPLNSSSHGDALESVVRLQKSSMHVIGKFIEEGWHEASSSRNQKQDTVRETELDEKTSDQQISVDFKSKGPSDEIWNLTESLEKRSETELPESATPYTSSVGKRTGRSLWNILTDVVRLRWSSHTENRNSAEKSGGKKSSNQSTSSEAWFSGHEQDENDVDLVRQKSSTPSDSSKVNQQLPVSSPPHTHGYHVDESIPAFLSVLESGSDIKDTSSGFSYAENSGRLLGKTNQISIATSMVGLEPSSSEHIQTGKSQKADEFLISGKTQTSASESLVQTEQLTGAVKDEVSEINQNEGELKRRKLQRTSQLPKDRFDEWEEAYKFEREQRKIDELFMNEAILEANKAADMWEVPVGAVLVQHGKIIARGYNLVEEMRDSTAHAEMICIREASNQLRSWRLADTTLYVTLEPCPMCAGAILQARVGTVVWGTPNKLLGADGSWIRLFPNGSEGGGMEPSDKPPAPVHPFHPNIIIRRGVLSVECADVMQQFFQLRRKNKEKKPETELENQQPTQPSTTSTTTTRTHHHHPSKIFTKLHHTFHLLFCL